MVAAEYWREPAHSQVSTIARPPRLSVESFTGKECTSASKSSRKAFRYQRSSRPHARLRPPSQKNCGANWRAQSNVKIALQYASSPRWLFRSASWVSQALSVATNLVSRQRRDPNAAASSAHLLVGLKPWLNTHLRDNLTLFSSVNNALTLVDQTYIVGGLDLRQRNRRPHVLFLPLPLSMSVSVSVSGVPCPVSRVPCPCQRVVLRWCGVDPRTRDTDLQTHTHTDARHNVSRHRPENTARTPGTHVSALAEALRTRDVMKTVTLKAGMHCVKGGMRPKRHSVYCARA